MKKKFVVKHYSLCDERIKGTYRIAFLTDLHSHVYGEHEEKLIEAIRAEKPDMILFGGDMMVVKTYAKMDLEPLEDILKAFAGEIPMYYALGNHEQRMQEEKETYPGYWKEFKALLAKYRIHLLANKGFELENGITVTGVRVPRYYYKKIRLRKPVFLNEIFTNQDCYNIFLAHTPAYVNQAWLGGADLVLSGHYHGGVMRLPRTRGLVSPQFIPFAKHCWGMYVNKHNPAQKAITGAGLGTHSVNIRFNNPPELVILDFGTGVGPSVQV